MSLWKVHIKWIKKLKNAHQVELVKTETFLFSLSHSFAENEADAHFLQGIAELEHAAASFDSLPRAELSLPLGWRLEFWSTRSLHSTKNSSEGFLVSSMKSSYQRVEFSVDTGFTLNTFKWFPLLSSAYLSWFSVNRVIL